MARVLLIQPEVNFERTYPLGLAYIAGHLRRAGVEVDGVDLRLDRAGLRRALGSRSYDVVGISAYSSNLAPSLAAAAEVRRRQPLALSVVGGPHVTLTGELPGGDGLWDVLVRGDGEQPMLALASGERAGPGIVAAGGAPDGGIHLHTELEQLDFPDRRVFPVETYYDDALKRGRWTAVIASRGCPRDCAYCSASALSGGRHRPRRVEAVVEELRQLRADHGVDGVLLEDDSLFVDRPWATALFEAIARAELGLTFELPNGVDPMLLDVELLGLLSRAGVASLSLGIETLVAENQRLLRRVIDPTHLRAVIDEGRRLGMRVAGFFIIGLPADTIGGIVSQYRQINALGLDLAHVSVLQDLPGLDLPRPAHSPGRRAAVMALHRLFYPYYYASPAKFAKTLRDAGASTRMLRKMVIRFANWITR